MPSTQRSNLDAAIVVSVMDFFILGYMIMFHKEITLTTNVPILTFVAAAVLVLGCFVVKLKDVQGDNVAVVVRLNNMTEEHSVAIKTERDEREASEAKHKLLQAKLRGKIGELVEARSKGSQMQIGLRASEAKTRALHERLTVSADEHSTAKARLQKAREQRDDMRTKREQAEREMAILANRLSTCTASLDAGKNELEVKKEELEEKQADNASLAESVATATAQCDAAKQALGEMKQEITEQGVRMSEGAMSFVEQSKVVAELEDLLRASRDRINYLEFDLDVRLRSASSMKAAVVRLTDEVAFLRRSMVTVQLPAPKVSRVHDSATSIKVAAAPATPSSDSTGTMSVSPSGCISGSCSSSSSSSSTWGSLELFAVSPTTSPSLANAEAVHEYPPSRTQDCTDGIKDDAASATSIDGSTSTMATILSGSSGDDSDNTDSTGISSSDSDDDSVQPVAGASRVLPSPAKVAREATPAVVHTGAHNRPGKRGRGGRRGAGQAQQGSAKSTKAKRQTLSRYFCSV